MSSIEIVRFLRLVAPISESTWITVHRRVFIPGNPQPIFPGNAHQTIHGAQKDAWYWAQKGHCVYLSMGMYRNPGQANYPYPRADRTYSNLVACKNLYLDVDVKEDGYATTADAAAAVRGFLVWSKLPPPTCIVGSGSGGLHIYWTLNIAVDHAEFKNMAARLIAAGIEYGLKFDRQCTNDATRLLRVAGTWNFKHATTDPTLPQSEIILPTNVTLNYIAREEIHIDLMNERLARWPATVTPESKSKKTGGVDIHGLPLDENDDLTGGMKSDYPPISIDEVAKFCPFIKDTLDIAGAGYSEPLWKYSMALAARCTDPEATAHRLSSGHAGYDYTATENKLAQNHGSGPPMCHTIALLATQCATCPHSAFNTTPLGVELKLRTNGHPYAAASSAVPPGAAAIELPHPYFQKSDNLVYRPAEDKGEPIDGDVLVFEYALLPGAMVEAGKPFQFVFDTYQGEKQVTKRFDTNIVSDPTSFAKAFAAEGLTVNTKPELPRKFVSSYISQLQKKQDTLVTVPAFGWSQDKNGDMGFAFAGEFVSPAGTSRCARPEAGTENYRVMGDEQVWIDLMKLIVDPDRPDLACMIASSFAAPLVSMTGENGLLMGVTSPASGIGKSTALIGGQTVWSSPRVGGLSDTVTYTFSKCATLRHLPVFYDEIKGEAQLKIMTQIAFQLTRGQEKGRSDRSGKMRKVNEFKTLCGYAANGSIVDGVREEDKGTDASWLRMFEMKGVLLKNETPNFRSKVNDLLIKLGVNHGGIGRQYATYLGQNYQNIYTKLENTKASFGQLLGADPKVERFWIAAIASTMLAANIANSMGVVQFPLKEMGNFMFSEFRRMKQEMAEDPSDFTKENALLSTIGTFLNEKAPRNMVILDKTWTQPTRPPKGYASIRNDKNENGWGKLDVQISGDPLQIKITDAALSEWCTRTKRPKNILVDQMKRAMGAKMSAGMIGSGCRLASAKENMWVINAAPGTAIGDFLEYTVHHTFLPP